MSQTLVKDFTGELNLPFKPVNLNALLAKWSGAHSIKAQFKTITHTATNACDLSFVLTGTEDAIKAFQRHLVTELEALFP
jgi:hypothetical protein